MKLLSCPLYSSSLPAAALLAVAAMTGGCGRKPVGAAPWAVVADSTSADFDLDAIASSGELIMLTVSSPDLCYEYRGSYLGPGYLLCRRFADSQGVGLRVTLCRDSAEVFARLESGDGDIAAFPVARAATDSLQAFVADTTGGTRQRYMLIALKEKEDLCASLADFARKTTLAAVRKEEQALLAKPAVKRHVYSPLLNSKAGVISKYDGLFRQYAPQVRWDWRLLAAQCYQESTFDPRAKSFAGACGLMQIMPSTASLIGLPLDRIWEPEANISAAVRYIGQLQGKFADVRRPAERTRFVLAAYNCGYHHVRDAMALAREAGRDEGSWAVVREYILGLMRPEYYQRAVVKSGYMRGSETAAYVDNIMNRYASYRSVRSLRAYTPSALEPQKAKAKRKKYQAFGDADN